MYNLQIGMTLAEVLSAVLGGARQAIKYLSPDLVVKATAMYKSPKNARSKNMMVTVGQPNYKERLFVKQCRAAGEPFPVRKVQLKEWV